MSESNDNNVHKLPESNPVDSSYDLGKDAEIKKLPDREREKAELEEGINSALNILQREKSLLRKEQINKMQVRGKSPEEMRNNYKYTKDLSRNIRKVQKGINRLAIHKTTGKPPYKESSED